MIIKYFFSLLLLLGTTHLLAQTKTIRLENASFEGTPTDATIPTGWQGCTEGTTPDILPGFWGVYNESSEGETFIGLITRDDGTWESIGQRLPAPLHGRECYSFSVDLAHSKTYTGYNGVVKFRVWGGATKCEKDQLLGETDFIRHTDWETYDFEFAAKATIHYIIIEAYYRKGRFSHKGNVLIDNFSPITPCIRASLY